MLCGSAKCKRAASDAPHVSRQDYLWQERFTLQGEREKFGPVSRTTRRSPIGHFCIGAPWFSFKKTFLAVESPTWSGVMGEFHGAATPARRGTPWLNLRTNRASLGIKS